MYIHNQNFLSPFSWITDHLKFIPWNNFPIFLKVKYYKMYVKSLWIHEEQKNLILNHSFTLFIEDSPLPSNLAPRSNVPRWFPRRDSSSLAVRKADCVAAAEACQGSEHCALLHENFKNACGTGTAQCRTLSGRLKCMGLRQSLKRTVLWECQCGLPLEKDCVQIRKSLFGDICIQDAQMEQIPTFSQDNQDGFKEDVASGWYLKEELRNIK